MDVSPRESVGESVHLLWTGHPRAQSPSVDTPIGSCCIVVWSNVGVKRRGVNTYLVCQNGRQTSTYGISEPQKAQYCPLTHNAKIERSCGVNCFGGWGDWTGCVAYPLCYFLVKYEGVFPAGGGLAAGHSRTPIQLDILDGFGEYEETRLESTYDGVGTHLLVGYHSGSCPDTPEYADWLINQGNTGSLLTKSLPGQRARFFTVITEASLGGRPCLPISQRVVTMECSLYYGYDRVGGSSYAVNPQASTSSRAVYSGVSSERVITVGAIGGADKRFPYLFDTNVKDSVVVSPHSDCFGDWGDYSGACAVDGVYEQRSFFPTNTSTPEAGYGGQPCAYEIGEEDTRLCTAPFFWTAENFSDIGNYTTCTASWSSFGVCSEGRQYAYYDAYDVNIMFCPLEPGFNVSRVCGQNCVGAWQTWSSCAFDRGGDWELENGVYQPKFYEFCFFEIVKEAPFELLALAGAQAYEDRVRSEREAREKEVGGRGIWIWEKIHLPWKMMTHDSVVIC